MPKTKPHRSPRKREAGVRAWGIKSKYSGKFMRIEWTRPLKGAFDLSAYEIVRVLITEIKPRRKR